MTVTGQCMYHWLFSAAFSGNKIIFLILSYAALLQLLLYHTEYKGTYTIIILRVYQDHVELMQQQFHTAL